MFESFSHRFPFADIHCLDHNGVPICGFENRNKPCVGGKITTNWLTGFTVWEDSHQAPERCFRCQIHIESTKRAISELKF